MHEMYLIVLYCCRNIPNFSLCHFLQVTLLTVTLVYYIYYIYHSVITMDVVDLLQKHNYRRHVDVSFLATWEQVRESN